MTSASDFSIIQDFSYGDDLNHYRVGPTEMKLYKNSLLLVSGVVYKTGEALGHGVVMMFDKDDISNIREHTRFIQTTSTIYYPS